MKETTTKKTKDDARNMTINTSNLRLGALLRELRHKSKKTLADFARATSKDNGTVFAQIETGDSKNPTWRNLLDYSKGLGMPLSTIIAIWETEDKAKKSVLWHLSSALLERKCPNLERSGTCAIGEDCYCKGVFAAQKETRDKELADLRKANAALVELLLKSGIEFDEKQIINV